MPSTIILIRHAESLPDPSIPEADWPLSARGERQAARLAETLDVDHITSSPYLRAIETVRPSAMRLGLEVDIHDDLRERKLAGSLIDDWQTALRRSWEDFDLALPGGETMRACQSRVMVALARIADTHGGKRIAVASHGNAIAAALNALDAGFGFEQWAGMRNPHLYRLERRGADWHWHRDD